MRRYGHKLTLVSLSDLGATVRIRPNDARAQILDAILTSKGDVTAAAATLKTTPRTVYRFIERLHLWGAIDEQAKKHGIVRVVQGRPRAVDRMRTAVLAANGNLVKAARALGMKLDILRERVESAGIREDINRVLRASGGEVLPDPKVA